MTDLPDGLLSDAGETTIYSKPNLATFFAARLDEEDASARAAESVDPSPWEAGRDGSGVDPEDDWDIPVRQANGSSLCTSPGDGVRGGHSAETARHIARWDPARVLAEVAAKRSILAAFQADYNRDLYGGCGDDCEWKALDWVLRQFARPYADHPDYDEAWEA